MTEKPAKPATSKPAGSPSPARGGASLIRAKISKRAYFIHLDEGGFDQLGSWLRAERELTTA